MMSPFFIKTKREHCLLAKCATTYKIIVILKQQQCKNLGETLELESKAFNGTLI